MKKKSYRTNHIVQKKWHCFSCVSYIILFSLLLFILKYSDISFASFVFKQSSPSWTSLQPQARHKVNFPNLSSNMNWLYTSRTKLTTMDLFNIHLRFKYRKFKKNKENNTTNSFHIHIHSFWL